MSESEIAELQFLSYKEKTKAIDKLIEREREAMKKENILKEAYKNRVFQLGE